MSVGGASSPHNPSDFLDQRLPTPIADFEKDKQPDEIAFAYGKRGVPKMMEVLNIEHVTPNVAAKAFKVLTRICSSQETAQYSLAEGDLLDLTMRHISAHKTVGEPVSPAFALLSQLCSVSKGREQLAAYENVASIFCSVLQSTNPSIVLSCVMMLKGVLYSDIVNKTLATSEMITSLVSLLLVESKPLFSSAVQALAVMCRTPEICIVAADNGAIKNILFVILKEAQKSTSLHFGETLSSVALGLLQNISTATINKQQVVGAGAIAAVAPFLKLPKTCPEVALAAGVVMNLMVSEDGRWALSILPDMVKDLVDVSKNGDDNAKINASRSLVTFAELPAGAEVLKTVSEVDVE